MGVDGHHAPAAFIPGKDPAPIVQEAGWTLRAGLDRCGKSRPPKGIRSPDLLARSESTLSQPLQMHMVLCKAVTLLMR